MDKKTIDNSELEKILVRREKKRRKIAKAEMLGLEFNYTIDEAGNDDLGLEHEDCHQDMENWPDIDEVLK